MSLIFFVHLKKTKWRTQCFSACQQEVKRQERANAKLNGCLPVSNICIIKGLQDTHKFIADWNLTQPLIINNISALT